MVQISWRCIPGYEGLYKASTFGEIKALNFLRTGTERILKAQKNHKGYMMVTLSKDGESKTISVHRLVAITYLNNNDNLPQVNHKNGIKTDNRLSNLEWISVGNNIKHAYKFLGRKTNSEWMKLHNPQKGNMGKLHKSSKTVFQFDLNGNFIKEWGSSCEITREIGIPRQSINHCCNKTRENTPGGFIWRYTMEEMQTNI